jgi:E3 ubiquitin-protein transferase RMND5
MDAPLKEVAKIEKLSTKEICYPAHDSLEVILSALHEARSQVLAGNANEQTFAQLASLVDAKKKEIDERQKELYSSLSRMGKALDKVGYPPSFQ